MKLGIRSFLHKVTSPPPSGQPVEGPVKMVCVVNHGLKMGKGKIAAQVGHAAVTATLEMGKNEPNMLEAWLGQGQKKVCVKGNDADHLLEIAEAARDAGLQAVEIRDAGHTQIPAGSLTVVAIGPGRRKAINSITEDLKLL